MKPKLRYIRDGGDRMLVFSVWNDVRRSNVIWARVRISVRRHTNWSVHEFDFEFKVFGQ